LEDLHNVDIVFGTLLGPKKKNHCE
jgi:hypothetical protein